MDIGIIGDESNIEGLYAPFLFQFFSQGNPPLLNDNIIA
jgi:hypothetical protein